MSELTLLGQSKTQYPASPNTARLEWFPNPHPGRRYVVQFLCPEFTSVCPLTGQPDFATFEILYLPRERCLESKALKLYLASFRTFGAFHEDLVNRICRDIEEAIQPEAMLVRGRMNARGGISIVVDAESIGSQGGGMALLRSMLGGGGR